MKQLVFFLAILGIAAMSGCKKKELGPIKNDGKAPGPVSNVTVENQPGAAVLTYSIPSDPDLLYVKAKYTGRDGVVREFKSSYYQNSIRLDGFEKPENYTVELVAVDEGENKSTPVTVEVKPLLPPYLFTRSSIMVRVDFGGLRTSYKNPNGGDLAIVVLVLDDRGRYMPFNTSYTDLKEGSFSSRGLKSEPTQFGVFVRDRWNHVSDTLFLTATPLFEKKLNKKLFKPLVLPNDAGLGYGGSVAGVFNDVYDDRGYHTGEPSSLPSWFSFDMGVIAKISRLLWWMRDDGSWLYALHNPRVVEIYGSTNPNPDGSWESWTLLAKHEQIKPSGLPIGQVNNADRQAAAAGETIEFPLDVPPVRYIRFKTLSSWSSGAYSNFPELSVYGQPQ